LVQFFSTDETDAADVLSPGLPAKRWSHSHRIRIKYLQCWCTLMLKYTVHVYIVAFVVGVDSWKLYRHVPSTSTQLHISLLQTLAVGCIICPQNALKNKKAMLSERWLRDVPYIWIPWTIS